MENTKNKIGAIFLLIFILFIIIGGYFFMNYTINNDKNPKEKETSTKNEVRIDTTKDYIYYENEVELIDEVYKRDLVLNVKGFENINNTLKTEVDTINKNQVMVNGDTQLPNDTECENNLYSFSYRDYIDTEVLDYVSVVIIDYDYNCVSGSTPTAIKSYVFRKSTGKMLDNNELFQEFEVMEDAIIKKVQERLDFSQTLDETNTNIIDINGTINDIKMGQYNKNKALSISKNGNLMINFIVKSNKINYNDSIEIN